MPDSIESEPKQSDSFVQAGLLPWKLRPSGSLRVPKPHSMGSFVILLVILAYFSGWMRNELALTLLGTVFLIVLTYCYLGVFILGIIHRRKIKSLSMLLSCETVPVGGKGELCVSAKAPLYKNNFWRLPVILMRCELCLKTKDDRIIRSFADPGFEENSSFPVWERGAYCQDLKTGHYNKLVIFDAPGFFHLDLPILHDDNLKLLAVPSPAEKTVSFSPKSGGTKERKKIHYLKSGEFLDHRPYVPGDDPRRINWKLYSHAPMGELFVRDEENQPPPNSRLLILIDTEADRALYTLEEGRRAVDLLCEFALAAALDFSAMGINIFAGYTGGGIISSTPLASSELASAFAWPAALTWPNLERQDLPDAPNDMALLIFALPRTSKDSSALDRFLKKHHYRNDNEEVGNKGIFYKGIDVIFLNDIMGQIK